MYSHHVLRQVAQERHNDRLAEADSRRLVKQAQQARKRQRQSSTPLRDGSEVVIRPITSADAELLIDAFERLSARSRRSRFLMGKNQLSATELSYLTDIDHHDHEALGAVSRVDGRGVGVARFVRSADDPQAAEVAVTVVDEWQGRGLGAELLTRLARRAGQEGIRRFTALVSADNQAVAALIRATNFDVHVVASDQDLSEYEIRLAPDCVDGAALHPCS